MANLINSTIDYTVKNQPEYFVGAIKKGNTLAGNYLRVLPDITKETFIKKLVLAGGTVSQMDGRDCAWTPVQRINIDGKKMGVENFKINLEQCLEELDALYSENVYNSIGANKNKYPDTLESTLMATIQTALGNDIEKIIWGGPGNVVDGFQNGLVDKLLADSDSIKVAGTAITVANVLSEIEKVYNALPNQVLGEGLYDPERAKVSIFVDFNVYKYLRQALSTTPTATNVTLPSWTNVNGKIEYMGIEVVPVGMPVDTMVAGSKDNMLFLTDLLSDTQSIRAEQGKDLKTENTWYVKGKYRANADYIFSDELVIYSV